MKYLVGLPNLFCLLCFLSSLIVLGAQAQTIDFVFDKDKIPDPVRIIAAKTNFVSDGEDWLHFFGTVKGVYADGIWINGLYSKPGTIPATSQLANFFVLHFPYEVATEDFLDLNLQLVAKPAGTKRLSSVFGVHLLKCLDYGKVVAPTRSQ